MCQWSSSANSSLDYDIVRDVNIEQLVSFERSMPKNTFTNTNKYFK